MADDCTAYRYRKWKGMAAGHTAYTDKKRKRDGSWSLSIHRQEGWQLVALHTDRKQREMNTSVLLIPQDPKALDAHTHSVWVFLL